MKSSPAKSSPPGDDLAEMKSSWPKSSLAGYDFVKDDFGTTFGPASGPQRDPQTDPETGPKVRPEWDPRITHLAWKC